MHFEFSTATRIIFGRGAIQSIDDTALSLGSHALLVIGSTRKRADVLLSPLHQAGMRTTILQVDDEPTIASIEAGISLARENDCDLVIGFGGGSVLDTGKAIAILLTNQDDLLDYLEIIGKGRPLTIPAAPFVAIPTTAGTGTEVTANAVLGSPAHKVKVSLRSPLMLPRVALIDPELSATMPPSITAATGMDALTQVIEPYVSHLSTPITDTLCRDGILRASRALGPAYDNGSDIAARENMALVSLYGGLALANAKLGAVHGIAGPFGGMYHAPHGAVCAALLAPVMRKNILALLAHQPKSPAIQRYEGIAKIVTNKASAEILDGPRWVEELCTKMDIPGLSSYGFSKKDIPELSQKAIKASSMKGNPLVLDSEDIKEILLAAL